MTRRGTRQLREWPRIARRWFTSYYLIVPFFTALHPVHQFLLSEKVVWPTVIQNGLKGLKWVIWQAIRHCSTVRKKLNMVTIWHEEYFYWINSKFSFLVRLLILEGQKLIRTVPEFSYDSEMVHIPFHSHIKKHDIIYRACRLKLPFEIAVWNYYVYMRVSRICACTYCTIYAN